MAAGVSVMTVSNVVRGQDRLVNAETRKRVEKVISRLNYRINVSARNLRASEEYSVGVIIANDDPAFLNDPFISRLLSGLSNFLSSLDYTLDVQGVLPERFEKATILKKSGNDALCAILCGPLDLRRHHISLLQRLNQPVVIFQEVCKSPSPDIAIIRQDDHAGGQIIAQHLLKRPLKKAMFLRPRRDWSAIEQREMGIRAGLSRAGKTIQVSTLVAPSEAFDQVQQCVEAWLADNRPDAIIAATDIMAIAAFKACESTGLRVPQDIMVSGFNGFDAWRYTQPTITTMMSPAYEMGRLAGESLIARLREGRFKKRNILLPTSLQIGGSA